MGALEEIVHTPEEFRYFHFFGPLPTVKELEETLRRLRDQYKAIQVAVEQNTSIRIPYYASGKEGSPGLLDQQWFKKERLDQLAAVLVLWPAFEERGVIEVSTPEEVFAFFRLLSEIHNQRAFIKRERQKIIRP